MLDPTELVIRRVDPRSDIALARYADAAARYNHQEWGDLAQNHGPEQFRVLATSPTLGYKIFTAEAAGTHEVVGIVEIVMPHLADIVSAELYIRVDDEYQGFGIGRMLADFAEAEATRLGRTTHVCDISSQSRRSSRNARFAERRGYERTSVEIRQDIEIPLALAQQIPWSERLNDTILEIAWGVPPRQWFDELAAVASMRDPAGGGMSAAEVESYCHNAIAEGVTLLTALARDKKTGLLIASTRIEHTGSAIAENYTTWATDDERGRDIGPAVIQRALVELNLAFPQLHRVRTFTPEADPAALALNRSAGYHDVASYQRFSSAPAAR